MGMAELAQSKIDSGGSWDQQQVAGLTPEIYSQLKQIAYGRLQTFRAGITLNCTALVHEAFLKLCNNSPSLSNHNSENHFLAVASLAMRQILVDYARCKKAQKRGAGALQVTLQESRLATDTPELDILELDEALQQLALRDPQLEKLVMLRFFAGLNMRQIAEVLGRSIRSTERDWTRARVYLYRELAADGL